VLEPHEEVFLEFVDELDTGTVFVNRCNYLNPVLLWVGVSDLVLSFPCHVYSQGIGTESKANCTVDLKRQDRALKLS
jgi:hypothetical protein